MKLVIDRSRWLRGGKVSTMLRDEDDHMCCLGFACEALGVPARDMVSEMTPEDLGLPLAHLTKLPETSREIEEARVRHLSYLDTDLVTEAVKVNDSDSLTEKERERQITQILGRAGFEVEFQ